MSGSWGQTAKGQVGDAPSNGGWGQTANGPAATPSSAPAPPHHNAGGFWGAIQNAVHKLVVKPVQHDVKILNKSGYVGQQLVKAGTLVGQMPTGLYETGSVLVNPTVQLIEHGSSSEQFRAAREGPKQLGKAYLKQNIQTVEHPARNLLATGLTVLPFLSGGASAVARVGAAGTAAAELGDASTLAKAGEFAKTLPRKPVMPIRTLKVPSEKLKAPEGQYIGQEGVQGPPQLVQTRREVALSTSKTPLSRAVQAAEDKFLQRGLDKSIENGTTTRLGKIANRRVAAADSEVGRYTSAGRNVTAVMLEHTDRSPEGLTKAESSLTHFLRSANATPEEWANYARSQANDLAAAANGPVVKGKVRVRITDDEGKLVTTRVSVKAARKAATEHAQLANLADSLAEKGVLKMAEGSVQIDRGKFPEMAQQSDLQIEAQSTRENTLLSTGLMDEEGLQARKNLVLRQMGIADREGQGYTSLKSTRPVRPPGAFARSVGKVLPSPKFSLGGKATGKSIRLGMIPADTLRGSALSLRASNKLQGTTDLRGGLYEMGSDVMTNQDDWLVAHPGHKTPIPEDIKILMGKAESTLTEAEHKTLSQKWENFVHDNLLREAPSQEIGQRAPEGYRFVNKHLVPNALKESAGRGDMVGKYADVLNSAVTSATVYTKLGHLPQRFLTNATTNFIQGGLNPVALARSVAIAKKLTDREKLELEAFTGAHASQAPLIGATSSGKVIAGGRKLAGGWAKHVDAPFRLNSILYELRSIGYDTPEKIRQAIETLKDPTRSGLAGHEIMKLDGAVRRSNRAAMMYDGLNNVEKNSVSRYVWFYPWTKAAVRFAGHTVAEHPIKSAIGGQLGQLGVTTTRRELGAVPTYEPITKLWGGNDFPIVSDLGALTPYGTVANVADIAHDPLNADSGLPSLANPSLSGVENLIKGGHQGVMAEVGSFFQGVVSPTPEYQVGHALAHPKGSGLFPTTSKNLFGATALSTAFRALTFGTATPRKMNRAIANEDARKQHLKFRDIRIYSSK